jgi:hypothetical protein
MHAEAVWRLGDEYPGDARREFGDRRSRWRRRVGGANLNNVCCWLTSLFPVKAQDEVFGADPDTCVSGVLNPTATVKKVGRLPRLSGTWHYNSGGWHAQWAVLGLPIVNEAGEPIDQGLAMIPMSDLEREDTWFVAGMKASGSIACMPRTCSFPIIAYPVGAAGHRGQISDRNARRGVLSLGVRRASLHHSGWADPRIGPGRAGIRAAKGGVAHDRLYVLREANRIGRVSASTRRCGDDDRYRAFSCLSGGGRRRRGRRARRLSGSC